MKEFLSRSESETWGLGEKFGRRAKPGDVICLRGPLGSGKTRFVQGFARGAGFKGRVISPTFGLVREYRTRKLNLHHLDLFRIQPNEIANLGLDEYFSDPKGVCLIEWPDASAEVLPENRLEIKFAHRGEQERMLTFGAGFDASRFAPLKIHFYL